MFIVPKYGTSLDLRQHSAECNLVQIGANLVGHDQSGLCMALKTVMSCT